jgi:hypothetical protein
MMMFDMDNIKIFSDNRTTLKDASKDNHDGADIYMTESTLSVVNFDSVKSEYIKDMGLSETPKSSDALFSDERNNYYFIEFKNGRIDKAKIFEIRLKIFDSLLIFTDIIGKGIGFTRENMNYILVYNEDKNPLDENKGSDIQVSRSRDEIAKHFIEKKAKKKYIRFNLERFEKLYFKGVFTLTEGAFENEFVSKFSA